MTRSTSAGERLISNPLDPVTGAASVSFKTVAPSVRIGWGNLVPRGGRRWSIPFELGVVFANAPTAGLDLSGSACVRAALNCRSIATNAQLQAALQDEQDQLNDDVRVLRLIPVVSLGFGVTF